MSHPDLKAAAERWLAEDPDSQTQHELRALLERGDDLQPWFGARLEFGTAGMRGRLGPGPNRMNRANVRRVTAGLAAYLRSFGPESVRRGVVVGHDARRMSPEFARDVVSVLAGAGIPVVRFISVVPTPLVSFGVKHLRAAAGVMVTASHNPPEYNGYKVFWDHGAQIVPPHDRGISDCIDAIGPLSSVATSDLDDARRDGLVRDLDDEVADAYVAAVLALQRRPELPRELDVVYTPLHGVGGAMVQRVLRAGGVTRFHPVAAQWEPDGAFPTVRFPNPEEDGAMDLAIQLAEDRDADLILANDPDADRLAVVARDHAGALRPLTGNQIGALLGHYLLTEGQVPAHPLVLTTVVSSRLLSRMAAALGVAYADTLTGFKWIMDTAFARSADGSCQFLFGYEEALGYSAGTVTPDKDGISAALLFCEMAASIRAAGGTLFTRLEEIFRRFGLHASRLHTRNLTGSDGDRQRRAIMDGLRAHVPTAFGDGFAVEAVEDYQTGRDGLPPADLIAFAVEGGARVLARPSGTEPKVKFYFEVVVSMADDDAFATAEARAEAELDRLESGFLAALEGAG